MQPSNVVSALLLPVTDHLILSGHYGSKTPHAEIDSTRKSDLQQAIGQIVEWSLG